MEFDITPWGFLKGAAENNATASRRRVDGKNYTVLTWSPTVKAPSQKNYVINGYVNEQNIVERVETWLGENIMADMQILATYTGWKDFGGVMAPAKIVQTRGGWPFFEVNVTAARANPSDVATIAPAPAPAAGRGGAGGGAGRGAPPALMVTTEKLGDGLEGHFRGDVDDEVALALGDRLLDDVDAALANVVLERIDDARTKRRVHGRAVPRVVGWIHVQHHASRER